MRTRLSSLWEDIRTSYWFLPSLMSAGAVLLGFAMVRLDEAVGAEALLDVDWIYTRDAEGARAVLSVIAGSMITVAGVVFSITIVAFTLASSQFGTSVLRSFTRDRGNQIVLGTFLATFLYCLMVLRAVKPGNDGGEELVPHIAVAGGVGLALASLGVLIYFIHHVVSAMQAESILASLSSDMHDTMGRIFPGGVGGEAPPGRRPEEDLPARLEEEAARVQAAHSGYIQAIEGESLLALAKERDVVLRLELCPGEFVVRGAVVALLWPRERADQKTRRRVQAAIELGARRTYAQDVQFAIQQFPLVAMRAMSTSSYDIATAMNCIDRLGAGLIHLAEAGLPSRYRYDEHGRLRLVTHKQDFDDILEAALGALREFIRGNAAVSGYLLRTIWQIMQCTRQPGLHHALLYHARLLYEDTRQSLPQERDRARLEELYLRLREERMRPAA